MAAPMWNWHRLLAEWPHSRLEASGEAVGLPAGQMGNSEVGHLNLGAGFRVLQDLPRITAAIARRHVLRRTRRSVDGCRDVARARRPAPPHGARRPGRHPRRRRAPRGHGRARARAGLPADRVLFHAFTDGRDTPPRSADGYLPRPRGAPRRPRDDRDGQRSLLRHGSRQPLGSHAAGVRRDRPRPRAAARDAPRRPSPRRMRAARATSSSSRRSSTA